MFQVSLQLHLEDNDEGKPTHRSSDQNVAIFTIFCNFFTLVFYYLKYFTNDWTALTKSFM
jgi:hypothetical protein